MTENPTDRPSRAELVVAWSLLALVLAGFAAAISVLVSPGMVGFTRDDAIYTLGTRALLEGKGYVDLALPEHPGVFRFPPGFSLILLPFMAGGGDVVAQLQRAQLAAPLAAVAFLLLSYRYFRTRGGLSPVAGAACTAWVAFQPAALVHASRVMADVPFGALGLVGILAFEAAGTATAAWVGVGALLGFTVLVRYAGVALVLAAAVVLVGRRAWRELAGLAAGSALVLVPWLAYRQVLGGSDYAHAYAVLAPHDLAGVFKAAEIVAASFFGNAVPGMLLGGWYQALEPLRLTPAGLAVGLGLTSLVLVGLARGLARPTHGSSGLAEAYTLITFAMVAIYAFGFTWYAENFMQRAFIPVLPFVVLAATRALAGWRKLQAGLMGLGVASGVYGSLIALVILWLPPIVTRSYFQCFDAVRRLTPPDAMLMTTEDHMFALYTGRYCQTAPVYSGGVGGNPRTASARQAVQYMHQHRVSYLVGVPVYEWGEAHDRSIQLVNSLIYEAPGLLREVWLGPSHKFGLWEVDAKGLEVLAR